MISQFMSSSLTLGSVLMARSLLGILCLPLSAPPPNIKKKNKNKKQNAPTNQVHKQEVEWKPS